MNAPTTHDILALDPAQVTPDEFCDELFAYLETSGQSMYDETVTQLEHGLQCAYLAESAGYTMAIQVAALLHDIGHLLLDEHSQRADFLDGDMRHEVVGARILTRWFGPEVGSVVALHVPAKRYLVAIDDTYRTRLSESSMRSLAVQGGAMTDDEATAFAALAHSELAVELRRWDDLGKVRGGRTPGLEHWRSAVVATLLKSSADETDS